MTGFANIGAFVDAVNSGRSSYCSYRKQTPSLIPTATWIDLSMCAGNPPPNYYASAPLEAAVLDGARGLFHGPSKAPASKYLAELSVMGGSVVPTAIGLVKLIDVLMYYPFIDMDESSPQAMTNTVTLPRFVDGDGVLVMFVAQAPTTGSGTFTFDYVSQSGASKTSPSIACNVAALTASAYFVASPVGCPFLPLSDGDTGVRSITSITFSVPNGGLGALVLVKPIANLLLADASAVAEKTFIMHQAGLPVIHDDAYLSLIHDFRGNSTTPLAGHARFVWG